MTLSPVDTLWSGRGGGCSLHVARLFGRPITITTTYQTANQVAMRNFVGQRIVKNYYSSGEHMPLTIQHSSVVLVFGYQYGSKAAIVVGECAKISDDGQSRPLPNYRCEACNHPTFILYSEYLSKRVFLRLECQWQCITSCLTLPRAEPLLRCHSP